VSNLGLLRWQCGWIAAGLTVLACARKTPPAPAADSLSRGEQVVVEFRAAEFVTAQVLSVEHGKVRVQTSEDAEQLLADRGDVYRLTDTVQHPVLQQYAICQWSRDTWLVCHIERVEGEMLGVLDLEGERRTLNRNQVLQASSATSAGQERLFKKARARGLFESEARAAGRPRRPTGWRPSLGAMVLAKRGENWWSARITGGSDAGLTVSWSEQRAHERLRLVEVVPHPPYAWLAPPPPGSFVMIAGALGEPAWARVRVESSTETDAVVLDRDGAKRRVPLKEIVPLED
jgi:hypothetical protein